MRATPITITLTAGKVVKEIPPMGAMADLEAAQVVGLLLVTAEQMAKTARMAPEHLREQAEQA